MAAWHERAEIRAEATMTRKKDGDESCGTELCGPHFEGNLAADTRFGEHVHDKEKKSQILTS